MSKKPKKKFDYISHSRIQTGLCAHRYDQIYNKGLYKDRDTLTLRIGKFKHKFAQEYVNYCISYEYKNERGDICVGIESDIDIMKSIFKKYWPQYHIPEEHYQQIYNECLEFAMKPINFDNVLDTEKRFRIEFDSGKFVEGIMDIIRIYKFRGIPLKHNDEILHIFDYKNQANLLKSDEILTPQMRLYTFASYHFYPKFPYYRRGIYFLKYNTIRCFEEEDNPTPLMEIEIEVEETKQWLLREWEKLKEAKEYPAITGKHCYQWEGCPMLLDGTCPKIKKKDFIAIDDQVRKIFQMDLQLKDLKKKAKDYIDLNGNITVDGKEVGWIPDTKETYPFEQAYNLIKETDYDIAEEEFPKKVMNKFIKEVKNKADAKSILSNVEKIKEIEDDTKFTL